jgi:hypothetical protein
MQNQLTLRDISEEGRINVSTYSGSDFNILLSAMSKALT